MLLARIIHFLIGAGFGAGGGYLVWTHRAEVDQLFPPGPQGLPLMLVAGVGALSLGIVFLMSAIAPRPKRTARLQEAAARRAEKLRAADSYYAERSRAADRDWRSGKLPPLADPAARAPDPLFDQAPEREAELERQDDTLFDPAPAYAEAETSAAHAPATPATQPSARAAASKPVATSIPPTPAVFPSTATLSPIPRGVDPPPHAVAPSPAPAPVHAAAMAPMPSPITAPPPAAEPEETAAFVDIRAALAAGRLEDADRLLNISRETATGLALAELTGLAGDHAAAAGRDSNAKWLWRLALKRFGEEGALDSPAARKVAERLRRAGQ